jgi:hypothetical protein
MMGGFRLSMLLLLLSALSYAVFFFSNLFQPQAVVDPTKTAAIS